MMLTPSAAMVTSQPSIEIGLSPQPNRRGANHTFLPINGVVRTRSLWHRRSWLPLSEMSSRLYAGGGVPVTTGGGNPPWSVSGDLSGDTGPAPALTNRGLASHRGRSSFRPIQPRP